MRLRSLVFSLFLVPALSTAGAPEGMRAAELRNMLLQDCGSCHGLSFKGGLGPALLPGNLRDKPEDYLTATILYGRPGTPMPPWGPFLSPEEAQWMVRLLKEGVK